MSWLVRCLPPLYPFQLPKSHWRATLFCVALREEADQRGLLCCQSRKAPQARTRFVEDFHLSSASLMVKQVRPDFLLPLLTMMVRVEAMTQLIGMVQRA